MTLTFRSLLFVPGARSDRFDKAVAAGADTIIIDLEDAVLAEAKNEARTAALNWLAVRPDGTRAGLRINSPRTGDGCRDIGALEVSRANPDFVMVPKAETGTDMEIANEALGGSIPMIAVIESGRAMRNAYEIAAASTGGVLFGGADFSASLGADLTSWEAMLTARATISSACAACGVSAYDVPYLDVKDETGLSLSTKRAKALGFDGRACIHPAQVGAVNAAFTPSDDEMKAAKEIVEALEQSGGGAVLHNGKLVDRPIILAAQRTLAKAGR